MLRDRTAVITGSTSGIGLGLAEAFATAGYRLVINGIATPEQAQSLVHRLELQHSTQVLYHPANLVDPEQCTALIHDAQQHFGSVDILINNAGIQHVAPVEQFPADRWDAILAINLSAAFHTIRAVLPGMQRYNQGRILNIASVHGLVASIQKVAYVAAKHGIIGLTKVVALENAARGITCNAICPGFVHTPLVQKQIDDLTTQERISINEASAKLLRESSPPGASLPSKILLHSHSFFVPPLRQILPEHPFPSTADGLFNDFRRLKEADAATSPTNQCCIVRCSATCKGR